MKNEQLTKAQKFCKALFMVELQEDIPAKRFIPLEMGEAFGCITDILFEVNKIQYKWSNMKRRLEIV